MSTPRNPPRNCAVVRRMQFEHWRLRELGQDDVGREGALLGVRPVSHDLTVADRALLEGP
jgi:hypothetical protein